ncbi:unnamed protein product [Trichobilharzia regenti]|nr:unnamed protein product [Trichobilharzia regenti]
MTVIAPDTNSTFDTLFRRYEEVNLAEKDGSWDLHLLLRKLGLSEFDQYSYTHLLHYPRDRTPDATVQTLMEYSVDHSSFFNVCYRSLKLTMYENDDFLMHVGIVSREWEQFILTSLMADQFKSLIPTCGLHSFKDADNKTRLLSLLERQLNDIIKRLVNLQTDTSLVRSGRLSGGGGTEIDAVHKTSQTAASASNKIPVSPTLIVHRPSCWHK